MPEMANISDRRTDFGIPARSGDKRKSKNSISDAGIKLPRTGMKQALPSLRGQINRKLSRSVQVRSRRGRVRLGSGPVPAL